MIFFKIVCYFAHWAQRLFRSLRILRSGEARYDFEKKKNLNTYRLQLLSISNGKKVFEENQKSLRNVLNLKALAYFSSALYNDWKFVAIFG